MPDLSEIRLRHDAQDVRYVLFIGGIPYAWTTDNGQGLGTLLGSGAGTWMGLSESSIGGTEVVGARTVLPRAMAIISLTSRPGTVSVVVNIMVIVISV